MDTISRLSPPTAPVSDTDTFLRNTVNGSIWRRLDQHSDWLLPVNPADPAAAALLADTTWTDTDDEGWQIATPAAKHHRAA